MCKKLIFLVSFVVMIGLVGNAFATERHVGPGYRLTTLEAAFNASSAGDIITVHENTDGSAKRYTFSGGWMKSDDSKHNITFRAYHDGTKYDNIILNSPMEVAYKTGYTFEGFIHGDNPGNFHHGFIQWDRAGFTGGWHMIKNCIFANLNTQGVYYYATASSLNWNTTIENCTFVNITADNGLDMGKYCYDWTVKDCLFVNMKGWDQATSQWSNVVAVEYDTGKDLCYLDYCSFYNNQADFEPLDPTRLHDRSMARYGLWTTTDKPVQFANITDPCNELFGYLTFNNHYAIQHGDSDGSYRGARPTPEPATIALLGLGGLVLLRKRR
jgi:hypothetical protein